MTQAVTSATVQHRFLEPAMEARAHNLQQFNPSSQVDSLLEDIHVLALGFPPSSQRELLVTYVNAAIESNSHEARAELAVTGAADSLTHDLHHLERNDRGHHALTAKSLARRLRPALAILADADQLVGLKQLGAYCAVRDIIAATPRIQLLCKAVEYELGSGKFRLLRDLTESVGAARDRASGARTSEDRSEGHGES